MPTYKLLEQDYVLLSQPLLIKEFGRIKSQFLSQLHYWQTKNQGITHNGLQWVYNTAEDWAEQLQVSARHLKRIIKDLHNKGIIFIEKLSTHKSNRTNYYSINYASLAKLFKENEEPDAPSNNTSIEKVHSDKRSLPLGQNVPIYTKNTTKINQNISKQIEKKSTSKVLLEKWNEIIGEEMEQTLTLNKKRAQWLMAAFKHKFNSSFELWEKFCNQIKSSDFLMGRIKETFKIMLEWAIRFDIIDRILEGQFGIKLDKGQEVQEKIPQAEEIIDTIDQSCESKLIKIARKNIIQKIGSSAYLSWFSRANFNENKEQIYIFANNSFAESYIQQNYLKILEELGIKLLEIKWSNLPLADVIEALEMIEGVKDTQNNIYIQDLHINILEKVGPEQYKKWFYRYQYNMFARKQFEMHIDNPDEQNYIKKNYQDLCAALGITIIEKSFSNGSQVISDPSTCNFNQLDQEVLRAA